MDANKNPPSKIFDALLDEGYSVVANVNSTMILNCQLNATAESVGWSYFDEQKNQHQIHDGRRMNTIFSSTGRFSVDVTSGSSSLTVDRVQLQDGGYYQCYTESTHQLQTFRMFVAGMSTIFIQLYNFYEWQANRWPTRLSQALPFVSSPSLLLPVISGGARKISLPGHNRSTIISNKAHPIRPIIMTLGL